MSVSKMRYTVLKSRNDEQRALQVPVDAPFLIQVMRSNPNLGDHELIEILNGYIHQCNW